jgi:adenylate kinase
MIIAITGTPGTGKTSVANHLREKGFKVVDLNKLAIENKLLSGYDKKRKSKIVDIDKVNKYLTEFKAEEDIIFIEGHLSHLLKNVNFVILIRMHPKKLKKNLINRSWSQEKIKENIQAEILDIILCESVDLHDSNNLIEIDSTNKSIEDVSSTILKLAKEKFQNIKKYKIGSVDWSEEILKDS